MSSKIDRRKFMILAGTSVPGLGAFQEAVPPEAPEGGDADIPRVMSLFSFNGGIYYFDPAGLYVEVGQTVEWVGVSFRSAMAYHPSHDNHELRIPKNAEPFDSRVGGGAEPFDTPSGKRGPMITTPLLTNIWGWWAGSWPESLEVRRKILPVMETGRDGR